MYHVHLHTLIRATSVPHLDAILDDNQGFLPVSDYQGDLKLLQKR